MPQMIPTAMTLRPPSVLNMIRGHVCTPFEASRNARSFIGRSNRLAQGYLSANRARPAVTHSNPGPGSTKAAMPIRTSTQPAISRALCFIQVGITCCGLSALSIKTLYW